MVIGKAPDLRTRKRDTVKSKPQRELDIRVICLKAWLPGQCQKDMVPGILQLCSDPK